MLYKILRVRVERKKNMVEIPGWEELEVSGSSGCKFCGWRLNLKLPTLWQHLFVFKKSLRTLSD